MIESDTPMQGLYAILDLPHPHGLPVLAQLAAVIAGAGPGGLAAVQIRAKTATPAERRAVAAQVGPACLAAGVPCFINDDVELALSGIPGVTGLHLGQGDPGHDDVTGLRARACAAGIRLAVGLSTHDPAQLRTAVAARPDYVAYGPVAATRSKANPDPVVGFDGLADACRIAPGPVVAIGGLDPRGAARAVAVGAAMVAVIGGLVATTAAETEAAASAYVAAITEANRPLSIDEVHARIPVIPITALEELARWSDDLSVLAGLRLPTRFRPLVAGTAVRYRPSDVADLLAAIGKRDDETWADWDARGELGDAALVLLRRPR